MQLRRTAAWVFFVVLVVAGCSSSTDGNVAASVSATTTVSVPATTTTAAAAPTTSAPPSTTTTVAVTAASEPAPTTTVVADATTADPKILAQQLQAVLDRYEVLITKSRSDPNVPFTDVQLISDIREVATDRLIALFWLPKWSQYRDEGTAVRPSENHRGLLLTSVVVPKSDQIVGTYCFLDDDVTYRYATGEVTSDTVAMNEGTVEIVLDSGRWLVDSIDRSSKSQIFDVVVNPCLSVAISA